MTEQHPEAPKNRPQAPDPADIHSVLRGLRGMFDDSEEAPGSDLQQPRERRPVDPAAALRAAGITPPEEHQPAGDADDEPHIPLSYGEPRLRPGMSDKTRAYLRVILGEGDADALQIAARHDYSRHPRTDVVIPPKKADAAAPESSIEGGRHAKKRSLRSRFVLGTTALVASAAALFGLTSSEAPHEATPQPMPTHAQEHAPVMPPDAHVPRISVTTVEVAATADTVVTARHGEAMSVTVTMGDQNDRGPWAMTEEALRAGGIAHPTDVQIAAANPWMKTTQSREDARHLQAGSTVSYRFSNGALTAAAISR